MTIHSCLGAIVRTVVVKVLREVAAAARERDLRKGAVRRNGDMCLHGWCFFWEALRIAVGDVAIAMSAFQGGASGIAKAEDIFFGHDKLLLCL